jgi:AhpD family alkylhydroperoxidase
MSEPRLRYGQLAPEGLAKLRELEHYLNNGAGIEAPLRELVRLRVSMVNGCEFCVRFHTAELKKLNETAERIAVLQDWRSSELFSKRERAALAWAETVTNIQDGHAPDVVYEAVREQFTDVETVNLTLLIATINTWNRVSISLGTHSSHGSGVQA